MKPIKGMKVGDSTIRIRNNGIPVKVLLLGSGMKF